MYVIVYIYIYILYFTLNVTYDDNPRSGFNDQGNYWHGKLTWRSPFLHNNPGMGWFQKCDFLPFKSSFKGVNIAYINHWIF